MDVPQYISMQPMKWHQKLAFGLGHIFNDLCAAMWFSLLLIYFQYIVHFPDSIAGYLLLLGQAVDAVSTPLIGYESDRIQGSRCLGKRKTWHLFGEFH
jgi:Na+/melibiose symporter-like transporter